MIMINQNFFYSLEDNLVIPFIYIYEPSNQKYSYLDKKIETFPKVQNQIILKKNTKMRKERGENFCVIVNVVT